MTQARPKKHKESFFNLHFTSTVSISLVLFMIGLITSLYLATGYLARKSQENISMSVILDNEISDRDLSRLHRYLSAAGYTKDVVYISRDSALHEHIEAIGEDPSKFLGYNPLSASLEVYLKAEYANVDSIETVIKPKLAVFNGITELAYREDIFRMLANNIHRVSIILSLIALVLLFISIVLINNTIRLSIYSKRFIINTMQLVGAKNSFIRRPFVKRSIINSITATVIASLLLCGAVWFVMTQIGMAIGIEHLQWALPVFGIILAVSLIINYLATICAVNRYLRMRTNQLYFV